MENKDIVELETKQEEEEEGFTVVSRKKKQIKPPSSSSSCASTSSSSESSSSYSSSSSSSASSSAPASSSASSSSSTSSSSASSTSSSSVSASALPSISSSSSSSSSAASAPLLCYIMRGVPGSGKSTRAKELAGAEGVIHSTDDYFMVDGVYRFDPFMLPQYHAFNLEDFKESLRRRVKVVVCDNTNVRRCHFMPYYEAAVRAGYVTTIVTMPHPTASVAARRNLHGVPLEAITRMLSDWEN